MLKTIIHTTVSMVSARANMRNGISIKLTDEKIKPPMEANAKKTKVPVKNIAVAFKLVSVVIKRIRANLRSKAINVKYQYSIVS